MTKKGKLSVMRYRLITAAWKLAKIERFFLRIPFLRHWSKSRLDVSSIENEAIIIPIQQNIVGSESVVLPYQILAPLIEAASGHLILNQCPCRTAENCHNHPHNFGCLYLGEAVRSVPEKIGHQSTAEDALEHLHLGMEMGLVPMIVHASFDADLLSLPYEKILAICFCCDCCCTVRNHLRLGPSTFDDTIQRLPGLTVAISEACTGCGICIQRCPVQAIHLRDHQAFISQSLCKGCGLCADVCPVNAPTLILDDTEQTLNALYTRIRQRTDVGI